MTTPARQHEADAVELAYHTALIRYGLKAQEDALAMWQDIPTAGAARSGPWLLRLLRYIALRRQRARALTIAKYRLTRALRTGHTIARPGTSSESPVTIGDLEAEFEQLAGIDINISSVPEATTIPVEPITVTSTELDRLERDAQEEAQVVLDALGPSSLTRRLAELDLEEAAEKVDKQRTEAHQKSGRRQAAAVERLVLNGARSTTWTLAAKDKRAVGYVRFSTTGTPCGWCAMLISRGAVYRSEKSAKYAEGDLYHDNCKCDVMPVFSDEQYDQSDMFALNREYSELWPQVTRGLSGKAALSAWRAFIRKQQADAQEARPSSTSVQEA
ncbi:hypothetical protein [Kribbella sindirgiensis]|uniref:Minor capsid protein n=1 Tax=Kribbella sindirgiensis TaxID=1124744 RepID=A0A4R0I3L4_9ACTN|nr:hypothetical protein [Kribbella sindirgiensis]TCC19957.1 hypothetical protein E0H50_37655 [Kribbella sindirgiensis]